MAKKKAKEKTATATSGIEAAVLAEFDEAIKDISTEQCIDVAEDIIASLQIRIEGYRCDIENRD